MSISYDPMTGEPIETNDEIKDAKDEAVETANEASEAVEEVANRLEERYQRMMSGDQKFIDDEPLLVLIINSYDYYQSMPIGNKMLAVYKQIINRAASLKAAIILTDVPTTAQGFTSPEIVKAVFANKNILIFEDLRVQKLFEAPIQLLRANNKALKPGDAFFVTAAGVSRVKTPLQK